MNTAGSLLICVVQVTFVATAGILTSVILRKWLRTSAGLPLTMTLLSVILLTLCAFSSWPSWLDQFPRPSIRDSQTELVRGVSSRYQPNSMPVVIETNPAQSESLNTATWGQWFLDLQRLPLSDHDIVVEENLRRKTWSWWYVPGLIIASVFVVGLFRFIGGLWGIRGFIHASRQLSQPSLYEQVDLIRAELGCSRTVTIRESSQLALAATVGWRRPVVLLSESWKTWTDAQLRSVLAHEIAHVARGDFLATMVAQLGLLLHYYHPLVHWLANRLRLEQELAADAMASQVVGGSQVYLRAISQLALSQSPETVGWPVHTFLPPRRTFLRRIEMLRDVTIMPARASRTFQWGTMVCVAAVTLLAIGIRPPGGESMSATLSAQEKSATPAKSGGATNVASWWTNDPLDAVLEAWDKKAPSMNSVECSWHETRVFMPGSAISPALIDPLELAEQLPDIDRNVGWPSEVTEVSRQRTLRLMGKWRYLQDFSIGPSVEDLSAIVTDRISSNVGKVSLQYSSDRGGLGEESSWSDAQSVTFIPVRYLLRPANRGFVSAAKQEFVVKASDSATGLITLADNQGLELIVDASKDFVVTQGKRILPETGNTYWEFEVRWANSEGEGWRPTAWDMRVWDFISKAESPTMRCVATEFTWELNKTLELKDLTIQLPQDISIYDSEGKLVTSIKP